MKKLKANLGRFFAVSLLVAGLSWIWAGRLPALLYFFTGKPVQIHGIIGNRAGSVSGFLPGTFQFGPIEIRNILGQPYFVAFDESKYTSKYSAFTETTLKGRLVNFSEKSGFGAIRNFFQNRLGMIIPDNAQLLIVNEMPQSYWRYPILFLASIFLLIGAIWLNFRRQ